MDGRPRIKPKRSWRKQKLVNNKREIIRICSVHTNKMMKYDVKLLFSKLAGQFFLHKLL